MATVGDLKVNLSISTASFTTGLSRATHSVREAAAEMKLRLRTETNQARDALGLLGNQLGLQLPAQLQKFLSSANAVRPVLAGAFQATVVAGFASALTTAAIATKDFFDEWQTGERSFKSMLTLIGDMRLELNKMSKENLLQRREGILAEMAAVDAKIQNIGSVQDVGGFGMVGFAALRETWHMVRETDSPQMARAKELIGTQEKLKREFEAVTRALHALKEGMSGTARVIDDFVGPTMEMLLPESVEPLTAGLKELGRAWEEVDTKIRNSEFMEVWQTLNPDLSNLPLTRPGGFGESLTEEMKPMQQAMVEARRQIDEMKFAFMDFSAAGLSSIGDAVLGLQSWSSAARQIIADLGRMIWHMLVLRPLMNMLGGALFPGFSFAGGSGSFDGEFAAGGFIKPGHWGIAGERGAEPVFGGRTGVSVVPAGGNGGGTQITIDARGNDIHERRAAMRLAVRLADSISKKNDSDGRDRAFRRS